MGKIKVVNYNFSDGVNAYQWQQIRPLIAAQKEQVIKNLNSAPIKMACLINISHIQKEVFERFINIAYPQNLQEINLDSCILIFIHDYLWKPALLLEKEAELSHFMQANQDKIMRKIQEVAFWEKGRPKKKTVLLTIKKDDFIPPPSLNYSQFMVQFKRHLINKLERKTEQFLQQNPNVRIVDIALIKRKNQTTEQRKQQLEKDLKRKIYTIEDIMINDYPDIGINEIETEVKGYIQSCLARKQVFAIQGQLSHHQPSQALCQQIAKAIENPPPKLKRQCLAFKLKHIKGLKAEKAIMANDFEPIWREITNSTATRQYLREEFNKKERKFRYFLADQLAQFLLNSSEDRWLFPEYKALQAGTANKLNITLNQEIKEYQSVLKINQTAVISLDQGKLTRLKVTVGEEVNQQDPLFSISVLKNLLKHHPEILIEPVIDLINHPQSLKA